MFESLNELMVSPGFAVVINADSALLKPEHQPGVLYPGADLLVRFMRDYQRQIGLVSKRPDALIRSLLEKIQVDKRPILDVFPGFGVVGSTTLDNLVNVKHKALLGIQFAATRVEQKPSPIVMYIGGNKKDALTVAGQRGAVGLIIQETDLHNLQTSLGGHRNLYFRDSLERIF